ncbi:hypothetical protein [Paraburkholderia sp. BCC1885]|uniref:hypothetical protein n=1 Tax=Paraburkholderia sp. BCC1885 TaxID=2562669 RepID=UPI001182A9DB|nr:hypothetical protein [Paraburkholderia sp. BCC1885]
MDKKFRNSVVDAVQQGGLSDWKAGEGAASIRVEPDNVPAWEHSKLDGESQRTSTRLASFVLGTNPELHKKGTELQAVASSQHGRIVASMNNQAANAKLATRYPDTTALKNDLGKYIATQLKTPPAQGSSAQHNENDQLRRAQELYSWLDKNPGAKFTVTENEEARHAEVSVRLTIDAQYPDMRSEGRAAGSKPPCTGCVLWFNERGELSEYRDDQGRVPAGPLFMTPKSGMRTQFEAAKVKPDKANRLSNQDIDKVARTVQTQVSKVATQIHPVSSGNIHNIPRSPTDDDPTTPDYERAFEFGNKLPD